MDGVKRMKPFLPAKAVPILALILTAVSPGMTRAAGEDDLAAARLEVVRVRERIEQSARGIVAHLV